MGNVIGKIFKLTTFGESHGKSIGGIIDGCPAGLEINIDFIQDQLERFDNNIVATSKALFATTSIPSHYFWRKPFIGNKSTANI